MSHDPPPFSHILLVATPDLEAAGWAVQTVEEAGVERRRVRVFHQQLPSGVAAEDAPAHFSRLTSPWHWSRKGLLVGIPLGLAAWAVGMHWLWMPGIIAISAVWAWFARLYLDILQGDMTGHLRRLGVPDKDAPWWQTHITEGETLLVLTLTAEQVPAVTEALEAAGYHQRRLYLP
jgi:hypothetical protein